MHWDHLTVPRVDHWSGRISTATGLQLTAVDELMHHCSCAFCILVGYLSAPQMFSEKKTKPII